MISNQKIEMFKKKPGHEYLKRFFRVKKGEEHYEFNMLGTIFSKKIFFLRVAYLATQFVCQSTVAFIMKNIKMSFQKANN